eukprot:COSAG06_NODE_20016_length_813_cov_0.547619_1_plen_36_part_10
MESRDWSSDVCSSDRRDRAVRSGLARLVHGFHGVSN